VQTSIDLVTTFGSLERLQQATIEQLMSVNGIGKVVAESIAAWFIEPDNIRLLHKFTELGVQPFYEKKTGSMSGVHIVVTGSLETLSREEAAEAVRSRGGVFQSAVSKDTQYLVAGGKVGASKLAKAKAYGTSVITEEAFVKLLQ
jgi:DNA ligase (NAD+)